MHLDWSFKCNQPMAHQYAAAAADTPISKLWQQTDTMGDGAIVHENLSFKAHLRLQKVK